MKQCPAELMAGNPDGYQKFIKNNYGVERWEAKRAFDRAYDYYTSPKRYCKKVSKESFRKRLRKFANYESRRERLKWIREESLDGHEELASPPQVDRVSCVGEFLRKLREELVDYLRKRHPRMGYLYYFYIELWLMKSLDEFHLYTWDDIGRHFMVNPNVVQVRRREVIRRMARDNPSLYKKLTDVIHGSKRRLPDYF